MHSNKQNTTGSQSPVKDHSTGKAGKHRSYCFNINHRRFDPTEANACISNPQVQSTWALTGSKTQGTRVLVTQKGNDCHSKLTLDNS